MSDAIANLVDSTSSVGDYDSIDELEILVHDLRDTNTKDDFFTKISAINKKIDTIRESVEKLCETTSGCVETIACTRPEPLDKTKLN